VAAPATTATTAASAPAPGASAAAGPTPSGTTGAGATPSAAPTSSPSASPDGVAVALRATGDSWVSVRDASGRTVFTGLLSKGDARRFSDGHGLRLTLGNAGAVQLTVNGKPIGSAGGRGEVVRLHFGPGDPA
jgi:cytoskeletal protein RodZ